jgi:hypothetical protein
MGQSSKLASRVRRRDHIFVSVLSSDFAAVCASDAIRGRAIPKEDSSSIDGARKIRILKMDAFKKSK